MKTYFYNASFHSMMPYHNDFERACGAVLTAALQTFSTCSVLVVLLMERLCPYSSDDSTLYKCCKTFIPVGLFMMNMLIKWANDNDLSRIKKKLKEHDQRHSAAEQQLAAHDQRLSEHGRRHSAAEQRFSEMDGTRYQEFQWNLILDKSE
jgi:hypothetical protein